MSATHVSVRDYIAKVDQLCRGALCNFLSRPIPFLARAIGLGSSGWTSNVVQSNLYKRLRVLLYFGFQWTQQSPDHTSFYLPLLTPGWNSHQVKNTEACIQNSHKLCTLLLSLAVSMLPCGTITERNRNHFLELSHLLFPPEGAPSQPHPGCRIPENIQETAKNNLSFKSTSINNKQTHHFSLISPSYILNDVITSTYCIYLPLYDSLVAFLCFGWKHQLNK